MKAGNLRLESHFCIKHYYLSLVFTKISFFCRYQRAILFLRERGLRCHCIINKGPNRERSPHVLPTIRVYASTFLCHLSWPWQLKQIVARTGFDILKMCKVCDSVIEYATNMFLRSTPIFRVLHGLYKLTFIYTLIIVMIVRQIKHMFHYDNISFGKTLEAGSQQILFPLG